MTPPLLRKMLETHVGALVVFGDVIIEPMTQCVVARGFSSREKAIAAARSMNEIAVWFGILKTRSNGLRPNCQNELERIAREHGGQIAGGADLRTNKICEAVVKAKEAP